MSLRPLHIGSLEVDPPVIMAPMAGFTDGIFRGLLRGFGGCGLLFTEMVSAEGLLRGNRGTFDLLPAPEERADTGVQLFGSQPGRVAEAAFQLEGMGVRLVDINMGCPARKVVVEGAGAALLRDPARAAALVAAVKKKSTSP
jgi:tRNA-dihydrouridine synthase